jgi:sarcosine oxidase subunit delta
MGEFLYMRSNPKGVHPPSAGATRTAAGASSIALRDTTSDKILATYKAGEPRARISRSRCPEAR